tara:strand:+ start:38281 stop:39222 length:942 start_codon:yes stop_codon:yes gene_type:complete
MHQDSAIPDMGWGHPEHQGRLRAIASAVGKDLLTLHDKVIQIDPGEATEEDLLRVHSHEHIRLIRDSANKAERNSKLVQLDPDTMVSSASWRAAIGSSGALLNAVKAVTNRDLTSAFVATRPPGHHATLDRAMGFCLINHIAVAARWLQAMGHVDRVLIVDWDVHHGNGTQDIFYSDGTVFYLSLHQWPHYPGSGAKDEIGDGEGWGWTLNVPLPAQTSSGDYREHFLEALDCALNICRPEFVLISAGFDVMIGDPLGGMLLEPEDIYTLTRDVIEHTGEDIGIVAALEGGYDIRQTGLGTVALIRALAGIDI